MMSGKAWSAKRWQLGFVCLALMTALSVAVPIGPAPAEASEEVEIAVILDRTTTPFTRTWSSVGAIVDSGIWRTLAFHFGAANSPVVGLAHFDTLFANDEDTGTFTVHRKIQVRQAPDDPNATVHDGQWHVIDATGIYAGLKGHGTLQGDDRNGVSVSVMVGTLGF